MIAITEINFDELYDESVLMFDSLSEEELYQIIVEGIIPEVIKQKASHIIEKWGKIDPRKKIAEIETKLKQQGVGAKKVKDIATKHAKLALKQAKPHMTDPKKAASIIKRHYRAAEKEVQELSDIEKWGGSVLLLVVVLVINTFLLQVAAGFCFAFGLPMIYAMVITAVLVAPITEETAKFISIKKKATGQFFTIFNVAEFSMYMANLTAMGVPVLLAAVARLMAVGLHAATTWVQWTYRKKGEKAGEKDDKTAKKGLKIGMVMHAAWNFLFSLGAF